jgi:hypothetical protein
MSEDPYDHRGVLQHLQYLQIDLEPGSPPFHVARLPTIQARPGLILLDFVTEASFDSITEHFSWHTEPDAVHLTDHRTASALRVPLIYLSERLSGFDINATAQGFRFQLRPTSELPDRLWLAAALPGFPQIDPPDWIPRKESITRPLNERWLQPIEIPRIVDPSGPAGLDA